MKLKKSEEIKVMRDGNSYDVIEFLPETGEVCVEIELDFHDIPHKRKRKCWWGKDSYDFIY